MSNGDELDDFLYQVFRRPDELAGLADAFYAMLKARGQLRSHRLLTYRCQRRCLLLDVLRTSHGVIVHQPRYKLSPEVNEQTSSPDGRTNNTEDGDRRWRGHTFPVEFAINFVLNCDHVNQHVLDRDQVQADVDATRREVVVRP